MLGKNKDDDKMLIVDFMLMDYRVNMVGTNNSNIIHLTGLLNVPNMFNKKQTRAFRNINSIGVMNKLAIELGLELDQSLNFSTSDIMTWYQINQTNFDFLLSTLQRSYKSNDMILGYCEIDKDFNPNIKDKLKITSLYTEMNKKEYKNAKYSLDYCTQEYFKDDDSNKEVIWYNYLDYINLNGEYNKLNNYGVKFNYWNKTTDITKEVRDKNYKFTQLSFKDSNNVNNIVDQINMPTLNNVYDNYFKAIVQNKYYKYNFFSFGLALNINSLNNVKLLDKVQLNVPSIPSLTGNETNEILTGTYLIGGITYQIRKGGIYNKGIILHRDGMNKSNFMKQFRNT
jgi:hypothetical protein